MEFTGIPPIAAPRFKIFIIFPTRNSIWAARAGDDETMAFDLMHDNHHNYDEEENGERRLRIMSRD